MIPPARDGWTAQQITDALHAKSGSMHVKFRYDVLQNGVRARSVSATGEVSLDRSAEIMRTARFELYEELDWLKEEIKPYMLLRMDDSEEEQYAEFPLGVFIPSTAKRASRDGLTTWQVEAYDRTVILLEDKLVTPLYIAAGTKYLTAVQSMLQSAGITQVSVYDFVDTELPIDREFEIGTSKLEIANTLLDEINFNPVYCDADGNFILSAYTEPSSMLVTGKYVADELSIIGRDTQGELDYFDVPNIFIAVFSSPDLDTDLVSVYTNDNPVSPFSTVQRRRNIVGDIYEPDAIASQDDLDAYIQRIAFETTNDKYEPFNFVTALNPLHGVREILSIQHPDAAGVYVESAWSLPLVAGGSMTHATKRLVQL